MAICLSIYDCAGLLPEHCIPPLASIFSRRPSVTSRARRGRRHDQKVPIVIASEAWRSAFSRFSKKWELERRTVDCHAVLPNVLSLISLCLMAKRLAMTNLIHPRSQSKSAVSPRPSCISPRAIIVSTSSLENQPTSLISFGSKLPVCAPARQNTIWNSLLLLPCWG